MNDTPVKVEKQTIFDDWQIDYFFYRKLSIKENFRHLNGNLFRVRILFTETIFTRPFKNFLQSKYTQFDT